MFIYSILTQKKWEDGKMGKWEDEKMRRWDNGEMGR